MKYQVDKKGLVHHHEVKSIEKLKLLHLLVFVFFDFLYLKGEVKEYL